MKLDEKWAITRAKLDLKWAKTGLKLHGSFTSNPTKRPRFCTKLIRLIPQTCDCDQYRQNTHSKLFKTTLICFIFYLVFYPGNVTRATNEHSLHDYTFILQRFTTNACLISHSETKVGHVKSVAQTEPVALQKKQACNSSRTTLPTDHIHF